MPIRNTVARLRQLAVAKKNWLPDYALGKMFGWEDRFHRRHLDALPQHRSSIEELLASVLGMTGAAVADLEMEFRDVQLQLQPYLELPAVADPQLARSLYILVRAFQPVTVVETGVWHGVSSVATLRALKKNGAGRLFSIDMPPLNPNIRVKVGGAVPDRLRDSWELSIGPSRQLLPALLSRLKSLSMFIHDSDHTYRSMIREYRTVWPYLEPRGVLMSDDIHMNDAFVDFAHAVQLKPFVFQRDKGGFSGLIVKR